MDGVTVREIVPAEYAAVGELVVEAYRTLGDAGDESYEPVLRDVAERAATGTVFVAEVDGEVVGRVTVSYGSTALSEVDDPNAATIRMLGVSRNARGQGLGEALVLRCIEEARAQACLRVRLDTRTSMKAAQRLVACRPNLTAQLRARPLTPTFEVLVRRLRPAVGVRRSTRRSSDIFGVLTDEVRFPLQVGIKRPHDTEPSRSQITR